MTAPCADCNLCDEGPTYARHPVQPIGRDFALADGIHVKQMVLPKKGMVVPQHSHRYDHTTMLAHGSVHIFAGDEDLGYRKAPCPIFIHKGVKHLFLSLEDNTVLYCIHNIRRSGAIEVAEEHHIVKE